MLEQATQNDLTENQSNFLELGFTENGNQESCFEHDVVNFMSGYKNKFAIVLLNINSIHEKFLDIKFILSKQLLDILIIAESKVDSRFDDEDFKSINYNINRRDKARRGGGLLLFIKKMSVSTSLNLTLFMK